MIKKTIFATALLGALATSSYAKQIRVELDGDKQGPATVDLKNGTVTVDCTNSTACCATYTITTADMVVNPQVGDPTVVEVLNTDGAVTNRVTGKYVSESVQNYDGGNIYGITLTAMVIMQ